MASKMTTLRLSDEDLTLIDKLRRITGIEAMSTLIREALKEYFQRHKPKPKVKKKTAKK
jgi:metal-responsive CopG/Arc/MetJ family transcriptional regulator